MERLKKEKEAHQLKVEVLRQEKLEAERKVEEKRLEEERLWLEAEKEKALALEREKEVAAEHQRLADLKEQEKAKKKKKEREDEANELALLAAGAPLASDGNSKSDPTDPKAIAMAELKRKHEIAKGKKRERTAEPRKRKLQSASTVDDSEVESGNASAGLSTPKWLKTEPVPQAKDKVFTGNGACYRQCSVQFVDFGFSRAL